MYHFPTWASLVVIAVVLTVAIVASLRADRREPRPDVDDIEHVMEDESEH